MAEGVACKHKRWVCARSRALRSVMCSVHIHRAGRTCWSRVRNRFLPRLKTILKSLMELLMLLWVDIFQSSSSSAFASYHHASAGFYLLTNCYENTSFTFSMFAVNTTSPLDTLADHRRRGPQTVKECVAHTSVGGGRLFFLSPFQAAAISPVLFLSPKRGFSACLNVTDCAKAASQTQRVIKKIPS